MKRYGKFLSLLLALTLIAAFAAGCGGGNEGEDQSAGETPSNLSISTGATSGTYYPLGTAIADVITKAGIGVNMTSEATGGSVENARFLGQQQTEIGFVESLVADMAYKGVDMFDGTKIENIRGLISLYPNTIQTVVKKDSGIESYADLKGKKVAVGVQGGSSPLNMQYLLESYDMTMEDIKPEYLAFGQAMELLKDNQLDAVMVDAGAPNSAIIDISTQHAIKILSIDVENIQKIKEKYPYFSDPVTIPVGTYSGVDEDVVTTGSKTTLCTRAELSDEMVYNILNAMFENKDKIAQIHEKGNSIILETALDAFSIPMHPGAVKYYEEHGLEVK